MARMESFNTILKLQELDMNMLRLMDLKKKRKGELEKVFGLRSDLEEQLAQKEADVLEAKKNIKLTEVRIREIGEKMAALEGKQSAVKKVEEFNALGTEITAASRERQGLERQIAEAEEKLVQEEELLEQIRESLTSTQDSSTALEKEIQEAVVKINKEGALLKAERDEVAKEAEPEILSVYERLFQNKKDRVVVPVENRACSGCHIVVTAQHENLVRKGERLIFCEHCSRLHYWPEALAEAGGRRRRRKTA